MFCNLSLPLQNYTVTPITLHLLALIAVTSQFSEEKPNVAKSRRTLLFCSYCYHSVVHIPSQPCSWVADVVAASNDGVCRLQLIGLRYVQQSATIIWSFLAFTYTPKGKQKHYCIIPYQKIQKHRALYLLHN